MTNQPNGMDGATPSLYAFVGTVLLAVAAACWVNLDEDRELFAILTAVFAAPGLYLVIAGAVARGIVTARR
ncbi:hypothetical protein [Nocardioides sp. URHA0020]|uniref:hypothetical protein n=1 Tax=Nocardioides sp. URHA0020 TaxID=1380392 RepID=UPI00048E4AF5|nr:hypothetical protein [Nocardioides sp. URHA0020]